MKRALAATRKRHAHLLAHKQFDLGSIGKFGGSSRRSATVLPHTCRMYAIASNHAPRGCPRHATNARSLPRSRRRCGGPSGHMELLDLNWLATNVTSSWRIQTSRG
jgi:hypothetical protein